MDLDSITADAVRQTLRALRYAGPLDDSPLMRLGALTAQIRSEGLSDTPASRAAVLGRWLDELIDEQMERHRGSTAPAKRSSGPGNELARLQVDFEMRAIERQAWGLLHYRYFAPSPIPVLELVEALDVSEKTYERRLSRGYRLLSALLRDIERQAIEAISMPHNLPQPLTSFVGREREAAEIRALITERRLVTLTGPGGIGKSRLALAIGHDLVPDFADGVWFVELASLEDDRLVPQAVASALKLREQTGRPALESLLDHLTGSRRLLIFDNCEQVVASVSELGRTLLAGCPELQFLATSRELLHVDGQAVYAVPPLALPTDLASTAPGSLLHYDAVRLFGRRAAAARPGFHADEETVQQVGRLCAQMEGMPLAIEMAAARLRLLSLDQLEARLADRFALLRDGRQASRAGHETLWAAMETSYELLSESEQALLRRLSVFRGGWALTAAEAVCSGDGVAEGEVLTLLSELDAKSLLQPRHGDSGVRYGMLETVREYAWSKLQQAGEDATWCDRHMAYHLDFVETAKKKLSGPDAAVWLDQLETDHANVMRAARWALEAGHVDSALRIAGELFPYWHTRARVKEGRMTLARVLAMPGAAGDSLAYATALDIAGCLAAIEGDFAAARPLHEESLAISRRIGNPECLAAVLNNLSALERDEGNLKAARSLIEECLAKAKEAGDSRRMMIARLNLGAVMGDLGDQDANRRHLEEALSLARVLEDVHTESDILGGLGLTAIGRDNESARQCFQQSLEIKRKLDDRYGVAITLLNRSAVDHLAGDYEAAQAACQESLTFWQDVGDEKGAALAMQGLASAAIGCGDLGRARACLARGLTLNRSLKEQGRMARTLLVWAQLESACGAHTRALRLAEAAAAHWRPPGPLPLLERDDHAAVKTAAQRELTDEDSARAASEGCALDLDEAVAYALGEVIWDELSGALAARLEATEVVYESHTE